MRWRFGKSHFFALRKLFDLSILRLLKRQRTKGCEQGKKLQIYKEEEKTVGLRGENE